jgi:L-iditol 2-dehydrogenase
VINAEEDVPKMFRQINDGRLADRVIVCAGSISACKQALKCVDRGGTVLFFAVPERGAEISVPIADFWRDEVTIMTSYGAAPTDLEEALRLIGERRINIHDMITHRFGLAEAGLGFRLVADAQESLKVIIEPQR